MFAANVDSFLCSCSRHDVLDAAADDVLDAAADEFGATECADTSTVCGLFQADPLVLGGTVLVRDDKILGGECVTPPNFGKFGVKFLDICLLSKTYKINNKMYFPTF